jgi:hypothetical protein
MASNATHGPRGFEGVLMLCPLCASRNQAQFAAEINVHLAGLKNVNKPTVLLFSNLVVCLDCGCSWLTIPEGELALLAKGN